MDRPERSGPDAHDDSGEADRGAAGTPPAEPRDASVQPEPPGSTPSFADDLAESGDLAEFDDLLESLRDAMRDADAAEPARAAEEAAGAPGKEGSPKASTARGAAAEPFDAETRADDVSATRHAEGIDYPDWLTNGSESQEAMNGVDAEVVERFGRLPRRHVYRSFECSRVSAHALRCRVTLSSNGREFVGEAEGPSVPGVRAEIAARATLEALNVAEGGRLALSLIAARVLRFSDMPLVVVSVYGMSDEEVNRLVGVSVVDTSEEQAAILATLQATDRWIAGVIGRSKS